MFNIKKAAKTTPDLIFVERNLLKITYKNIQAEKAKRYSNLDCNPTGAKTMTEKARERASAKISSNLYTDHFQIFARMKTGIKKPTKPPRKPKPGVHNL